MKRLTAITLLLAAFVAAQPPPASAEWIASGAVTNPANGTVLLDTGPLAIDATLHWCVVTAANVSAVFDIQYRNAANNATLREQYIPVTGSSLSNTFCSDTGGLVPPLVLAGERVRLTAVGLTVGTVSVSLFYDSQPF